MENAQEAHRPASQEGFVQPGGQQQRVARSCLCCGKSVQIMCQTDYCGQRCEQAGPHDAEASAAAGLGHHTVMLPAGPEE